ncbi:hybrid sensor histidine kinase/response regulator [Burkholderia vietnamiensis]|uniref:ATP-binding response regulator n=1 Tax=Burkholderia TaxID=32008 RepID=UPI0005D77FB9|nr:hybrid sensor histidine kinase/response regulator [Burkholderia vietnamiensis]AJY04667.1 response regulator [Burkholderia vietnamiensis LMG 10929]AVR12848.1 hybrid sensor histidine kinase/response regulator [Burkholderia vietnamiensis]KVM55453.1 hybrid sensor histidine kinase/response regulator [Burkholderia vietnamiensis]KVR97827.1 hybrid sensor histidine kinase/response regulator [Burkholderia vietnamiensis]MDN7552718.1 hybrid sensor histidine kinase/response regulator [Burkholderia vietn
MTMHPESPIAAEQLKLVYGIVTLSVCGGTLLAATLVVSLERLGRVDPLAGAAWLSYIVACSTAHACLAWRYHRSANRDTRRSRWAAGFVACSTAAGIGWGWSSIELAKGRGFEVESLAVTATLGVVAGAVPVFGTYLPAFLAFLLPATVPYVVAAALSDNRVQQATAPMMFLFVCVIAYLGLLANRSAAQNIRLRFRAEQLARDLRARNRTAKRLADDLLRQKQIAEDANLAKSRFLAAASHDLRQPSHALSLLVGALRGAKTDTERAQILVQIERSTDALDSLFGALLDVSRLDAGVVDVHRRPVHVDAVLEHACTDHLLDAAAKNLTLTRVPCRAIVDTDPVLLERIVRNLVSNAVRYTDAGRIVVGCRRRGARVAIQVWDTGRGIAADQLELVFQEYYQVGNPERDRANGLGLGLAIVRRLADLLECELKVRSAPGRGSCFEVWVSRCDHAAAQADASAEPADDVSHHSGLVVVVDDELAIRDGMARLLELWGYETIVSDSGDAAIERLSACARRPDLLVCDFRLRGAENGLTVIERLRSEYNDDIPALLISGDTAADRLAEAHASHCLLLHKPIPNDKLRAAIGNLIAAGVRARSGEPE